MLRSVKVQDYMTKRLVTFKPETDLFEAINVLIDAGISGAPVLDSRGALVGILSEVDCLKSILRYTYHDEEMGGKVGDFMTANVETVSQDADIIALSEKFIGNNRRRVPVLDGSGKLVGQISRKDVLRAVKEFVNKSS